MIVFVFWSVWRTVAIGEGFANRFGGQIDPKVFVGMLKPPVYGATCIDDQRAPVNKDFAKVCQLHDDKSLKTEVLVWGDSHMHHYYPAFRKAAKELTMNGYFLHEVGVMLLCLMKRRGIDTHIHMNRNSVLILMHTFTINIYQIHKLKLSF